MDSKKIVIGIPKEGEHSPGIPEGRVALTPAGVRDIVDLGAKVIVEQGAGTATGFTELEYQNAGAEIVYSHEEVFGRSDIVLKISPIKSKELLYLVPEKVLWGFSHLAVAPEEVLNIIREQKLSVIGYEIMEDSQGIRPLLRISSEIAGKMAAQIASQLLQNPPGMGLLLGGLPGIPPADVVILGAGALASYAALSCLGIGAMVYVLDFDRGKLEKIYELSQGRISTAAATKENIEKFVQFAEVLICAVLIPGEASPLLVSKEVISKMRPGSVIIDFSIDQGGVVETIREKGPQPKPYIEKGIVHFSLPNVPSLVPRTSSHAMTHAILPYLHAVLKKGWPNVLEAHPVLRRGIYYYKGNCVSSHLRGRDKVRLLDEVLKE